MVKTTKYVIFLGLQNGYFVAKKGVWPKKVAITYDIEKAKLYSSHSGAELGATELYDELPQIVTVEVTVEAIAMGEVITREAIETIKREKLESQMEKQRNELLDNWNKEQGING